LNLRGLPKRYLVAFCGLVGLVSPVVVASNWFIGVEQQMSKECSGLSSTKMNKSSEFARLIELTNNIDSRSSIGFEFLINQEKLAVREPILSNDVLTIDLREDERLWFESETRNSGIRFPLGEVSDTPGSTTIRFEIRHGGILSAYNNGKLYSRFDFRPLNPILRIETIRISNTALAESEGSSVCIWASQETPASKKRSALIILVSVFSLLLLLIFVFNRALVFVFPSDSDSACRKLP
jgi:hypothetical protein